MNAQWRRCFIALAPDAASRAALAKIAAPAAARVVHPADLHLTLAFLGAISAAQGQALSAALATLAAPVPPLAFTGIAYWPQPARARVMVATFAPCEALLRMVRHLRAVLIDLALPVEDRPFRPHVTLARFRPDSRTNGAAGDDAVAAGPEVAGTAPRAARFEAMALYASMPAAPGPRYRALASAALPAGH